jgi:uncharacterized membrane protein YfcA
MPRKPGLMTEFSVADLLHAFTEWKTWFVIAVTLLSGVMRGFSGFGGALIFVPLASAALGPRIAVPTFYLADLGSATPYGLAMMRKCRWDMVGPMLAGSWIGQPLGAAMLQHVDPLFLRWSMAGLVFLMLAILLTGWRFTGEQKTWITFLLGISSGLMGGATGIAGPLVIAYWLSGRGDMAVMRANIMVFYALTSITIDLIYFYKGMFTWDAVFYAAIFWPCYTIGIAVGARLFTIAPEKTFRHVAYAIMAVSALVSMPVFDGLIR